MKNLLQLRKNIKSKKPNFIRQDAEKKKLEKKWVRPRGWQNKVRLGYRSNRKKPSQGYRSPREVRGLHSSGLKEVLVYNLNDLNKITKDEGVIISKKVGLKKKLEILKEIKKVNLKVLNVKDIDDFIKKAEEKFKIKKELTKEKQKLKEKTKKEAVKAYEEKKEKEKKELTEEEVKEKEKKELTEEEVKEKTKKEKIKILEKGL